MFREIAKTCKEIKTEYGQFVLNASGWVANKKHEGEERHSPISLL